jgi:hypothetical protein
MSHTISESDWKLFRQLREIALDRFCQRVLSEIDRLAADAQKTSHERYLAIHRHLKRRDEELASAFDDPRRSTALQQLACIRAYTLLTEEEMLRFNRDTREVAEVLAGTFADSGT